MPVIMEMIFCKRSFDMQKIFSAIVLVTMIFFGIIACDNSSTPFNQNNNNDDPGIPGDNSAIGETLQLNGVPVYDYDTGYQPFVYDGTLILRSAGDNVFNGSTDAIVSASITNNLLSFTLSSVPAGKLLPVSNYFTATPASAKGVIVESFDYDNYDGSYDFDWDTFESYCISLSNKNNIDERIVYIYIDQNAVITGIDMEFYCELSLQKGWNTVKIDSASNTIKTFVPDENYIWLSNSEVGPEDYPYVPNLLFLPGKTINISGTINVKVNNTFPAGGITLELISKNELIDIYDIPNGTNPVSWEFNDLPQLQNHPSFHLTIYPQADRNTFYDIAYLPLQNDGNANVIDNDDYGDTEYEISNIVLGNININTMPVSVTVTGISNEATIYSDPNNYNFRYGMKIPNSGSYSFLLPNNIGNWLWFNLVPSSGQQYITKGRLYAGSAIILNTALMYPWQ